MILPWWAWVLIVLATVIFIMAKAAKAWRASIRQELLAYFDEHAPELELEVKAERELAVRHAGGEEGTLFLHNLLQEIGELKVDDPAQREELYEKLLVTCREQAGACELDPEKDRPRLRPRLLTEEMLTEMQHQGPGEPASRSFGVPGLLAVFVLDHEHSVRYLDSENLSELGLSVDQALELAKANLRDSMPREVVEGTVRGGDLNVIKGLDSYDAARLLLVPELLDAGEAMVALIPDRDTLALAQVPENNDWKPLRKLARNAAGPPLWEQPILVREDGFTPID